MVAVIVENCCRIWSREWEVGSFNFQVEVLNLPLPRTEGMLKALKISWSSVYNVSVDCRNGTEHARNSGLGCPSSSLEFLWTLNRSENWKLQSRIRCLNTMKFLPFCHKNAWKSLKFNPSSNTSSRYFFNWSLGTSLLCLCLYHYCSADTVR